VLRTIRRKLTYANVMSTLAVFIALGGSSYAVARISGSQLRDSSVSYKKLKRNTLGGTRIKESRLGKVRRARNADRLNGVTASELRVRCPAGTRLIADGCVEEKVRPPATLYGAEITCANDFRRVASWAEVAGVVRNFDIAVDPRGEFTSSVSHVQEDGQDYMRVLVVTDEAGSVTSVTDKGVNSRPYRCALDPTN